jgi:polyisoprenoid-binding protein YceI
MARFAFYFLVIWSAFCEPSLSEDFQFPEDTDVKFKYFVAGLPFEGKFKVVESSFDINFRNPVKSALSVEFDLMQSNAGFPLATSAMKQVLDAYKHPKVIFESASVKVEDKKFNIQGFLKIRDVSKPVKLVVTVLETYSPDSEKLLFSIQSSFQRRQFGADGYYPLVRDTIIIEDILMLNKSMKP